MVFSSTLQLRILGNHSLDKMLSDSRGDNNTNPKLHTAVSTDGTWQGIKQEEASRSNFLEDKESTRASPPTSSFMGQHDNYSVGTSSGFHGEWGGVPTSSDDGVGNDTSISSDWNVLSSNSFDETYLECAYTESSNGMTSINPSSVINHFDDPSTKHGMGDGNHEPPLFSSPYPGTSWFLGGKAPATSGNGFVLPTMDELTLNGPTSSASMLESSSAFDVSPRTPSLQSDAMATHSDKRSSDMVSCPAEVPSPVQMESFVPCVPYALEPSELLFEDMSSWNGASVDMYDQPRAQPLYSASSSQTAARSGYFYFDNSSINSQAVPCGSHGFVSSYQQPQHQTILSTTPSSYSTTSHGGASDACTRWVSTEPHRQYFTPSTSKTTSTEIAKTFTSHNSSNSNGVHDDRGFTTSQSQHVAGTCQTEPTTSRVLRSTTLNQRVSSNQYQSTGVLSKMTPPFDKTPPLPPSSPLSGPHGAKIELLTALNDCYWKNGRKNLQCFPACPEHHDFYSMKMNNRKHSSVGVCRGPVYCHAFTTAADFAPASSTQLKGDQGSSSNNSNGVSELLVLGRFERVPQQESTNLLEELLAPPTLANAAAFEQFRYACFQAVEMEERRVSLPGAAEEAPHDQPQMGHFVPDMMVRSTWFFLPDVWKVQPMLKKKRKATRSAPAQTFPFCFRVFIYRRDAQGPGYSCLADTASSFFELYSTRTVDRVKRKYWRGADEDGQSSKRR